MGLFDKKDDIFDLIEKFNTSTIMELEIEADDGVRIRLSRNPSTVYYPPAPYYEAGNYSAGAATVMHHVENTATGEPVSPAASASETSGKVIKAPIIGTFYSAASPETPPFVKVGDKITQGHVVCILEAMKVMNEIECEQDCEIVEILVSDGDAIQYGQPLFKIK